MIVASGCVVALLLPVLYTAVPNPVLFRWFWHVGHDPVEIQRVPIDVAEEAERVAKLLRWTVLGTLLVILYLCVRLFSIRWIELGVTLDNWPVALCDGVAAGAAWLAVYVRMATATWVQNGKPTDNLAARVKLPYWLSLSIVAASVEEVWRAYCLVTLAALGSTTATFITATAFGLAHLSSLGRAVIAGLFGVYIALLFLIVRSILATTTAHLIVNIGVWFIVQHIQRRLQS